MIKGHLVNTKTSITGNRYSTVASIYECETKEAITHFLETYDFEPCDIISLMHYYGINHSVKYEESEYADGIHHYCTIESDTLFFLFHNNELMECSKKYNILDELKEKYNLDI